MRLQQCVLGLGLLLASGGASAGEAGSWLADGFEENAGHFAPEARFRHRSGGACLFLTERGFALALRPSDGEGLALPGANLVFEVEGATGALHFEVEDPRPGVFHYFVGADPAEWRRDVRRYGRVIQRDLLPGLSLAWRLEGGRPEFDVIAAPGVSLDDVVFRCRGAERLAVEEGGALRIETAAGTLRQSAPTVLTRDHGGVATAAEGYVEVLGAERYRFRVGAPASLERVVDPYLEYATYLGGSVQGSDRVIGVTVDDSGRVITNGLTTSPDFPSTLGSFDPTFQWSLSHFVAAFEPDLGSLLFATFLGGSNNNDSIVESRVDRDGFLYLTGLAASPDFPQTAGNFGTGHIAGLEIIVSKLSPGGDALVYSGLVGGTGFEDIGTALDVDAMGRVYVTGKTQSPDLPVTPGAFDLSYNSGTDVFAARISASGTAIEYCTFIGAPAASGQTVSRSMIKAMRT